MLTSLILIYVLTSWVNGLVSARLYRQLGGKKWHWNIVTAALVFPGPLALVWSFLNSVAWGHQSTRALPAATIAIIAALFLLVSFRAWNGCHNLLLCSALSFSLSYSRCWTTHSLTPPIHT